MQRETGTFTVKSGLAEMLKGGVIMDVTDDAQARIAEEAGAVAVMALERVPADHAVAIYRQLPDARLLIAPDTPHQVMVSQPALFNQAAAVFYRSTEQVARERLHVFDRAATHVVEAGGQFQPEHQALGGFIEVGRRPEGF